MAKEQLADVIADYPNVTFSPINDAMIHPQGTYASAMETLYESAALAMLAVFVVLRN